MNKIEVIDTLNDTQFIEYIDHKDIRRAVKQKDIKYILTRLKQLCDSLEESDESDAENTIYNDVVRNFTEYTEALRNLKSRAMSKIVVVVTIIGFAYVFIKGAFF